MFPSLAPGYARGPQLEKQDGERPAVRTAPEPVETPRAEPAQPEPVAVAPSGQAAEFDVEVEGEVFKVRVSGAGMSVVAGNAAPAAPQHRWKKKRFDKVLIANRGEIAIRVMRACRELGIATAAVYSDADRSAIHVRYADEAHHIGGAAPTDSYLQLERIVKVARDCGADAVHPGYGFLAEKAAFPEACEAAGIAFIGPPASAMRALSSKLAARKLAADHGVPVTPGSGAVEAATALEAARKVGFPVMLKPSGGGGGIGMKVVESEKELAAAIESTTQAARSAFGDATVYLERYVRHPRHIEIQVVCDRHGHAVHLGERECSIQ